MRLGETVATTKTYGRTLPVYLAGAFLFAYVLLTVLWLIPDWAQMQRVEVFSHLWHLGIVALIVGALYFEPQLGSWFALGWCVFVPLERYALLFREVTEMVSGGSLSLAMVDVVRIALLLAASTASAWSVYRMHQIQQASKDAESNA
jgi:hypothetical protein